MNPRRQYFFYKWLQTKIIKLPERVFESKLMKDISSAVDQFEFDDTEMKCELCSCCILFTTLTITIEIPSFCYITTLSAVSLFRY